MPEHNAAGGLKGEPQDAASNPSCSWMLSKIKLDPGMRRDDDQKRIPSHGTSLCCTG